MYYSKLCHDFSIHCLPFHSIDMKRFSVSEDDNKVGSQDRLGYVLFNNNSGSSVKAIRKVYTHLTDEPKN